MDSRFDLKTMLREIEEDEKRDQTGSQRLSQAQINRLFSQKRKRRKVATAPSAAAENRPRDDRVAEQAPVGPDPAEPVFDRTPTKSPDSTAHSLEESRFRPAPGDRPPEQLTGADIGRLLVSRGILAPNLLGKMDTKVPAATFVSRLIRQNVAPKRELGKFWGELLGVAHVDLEKTLFQKHVVELLPEKYARNNRTILVYAFGGQVVLATSQPKNKELIAEVQGLINQPVSPVFAFPDEIVDAIEIQYHQPETTIEMEHLQTSETGKMSQANARIKEPDEQSESAPIVRYSRSLLLQAAKERASDIHIEPGDELVRIRFRIDGRLREVTTIDKPLLPPLASRLKIMASLDISEKRRPQDGRISLKLLTQSIDFRFSSIPTIYGEKIVLRLLGQLEKKEAPSLDDMVFSCQELEHLKRGIRHPNGLFFVTGPTGSGKTTTLYAALDFLNEIEVNIMTIEDPVEIRVDGLNQVQINPAAGLNFADGLRSFLRQDPDIILVGEIRDRETARIASEAALTGHLVMATMHTNDALQAVTRLCEMGVESYLVAPSLVGVLSQRLVRRVCPHCKEPYPLSRQDMDRLFVWDGQAPVSFSRGKGCAQCHDTGYYGRLAIHELLTITDEMRDLIARDVSIEKLKECAQRSGFRRLRYDGIKKVLRGLTTLEEIDRVAV